MTSSWSLHTLPHSGRHQSDAEDYSNGLNRRRIRDQPYRYEERETIVIGGQEMVIIIVMERWYRTFEWPSAPATRRNYTILVPGNPKVIGSRVEGKLADEILGIEALVQSFSREAGIPSGMRPGLADTTYEFIRR